MSVARPDDASVLNVTTASSPARSSSSEISMSELDTVELGLAELSNFAAREVWM